MLSIRREYIGFSIAAMMRASQARSWASIFQFRFSKAVWKYAESIAAVSVRPDRGYRAFQGRSSSIRLILWSGMRARVPASQAWGSTPLSLAVSIRV